MALKFDNILHVYGQEQWHDDVIIMGDETALRNLIKIIEKALKGETVAEEENCFFTKDGEGFSVLIKCEKDMEKTRLPYYGEIAQEKWD